MSNTETVEVSKQALAGIADQHITEDVWLTAADARVEMLGEQLNEAGLDQESVTTRFEEDPEFLTVDADELRKMLNVTLNGLIDMLNLALAAKMIFRANGMLRDALEIDMAQHADSEVASAAERVKEALDDAS